MIITDHALERYQEHCHRATKKDLLQVITKGDSLDPGLVWALTQRRSHIPTGETYVAPPSKQGIFVIDSAGVVITYLRLGLQAQRILMGSSGVETPLLSSRHKVRDLLHLSRTPTLSRSHFLLKDRFQEALGIITTSEPTLVSPMEISWKEGVMVKPSNLPDNYYVVWP